MSTARRALSLIAECSATLAASGIPEPAREAELMLIHACGIHRADLWRDDPDVTPESETRYRSLIRRRAAREPLQYITGEAPFLDIIIDVGPGVLIPRPETELLAQEAIRILSARTGGVRCLDLCTGSGCIAIAIARALPHAEVFGVDLSEMAIGYATANAERYGVRNAHFQQGNLFEPYQDMRFDMIVSNPPYIVTEEIAHLAPEIRDWEPREALEAGPDGMDFYRIILNNAPAHLHPGGMLLLELGAGQADDVEAISNSGGRLVADAILSDYAGIRRVFRSRAQ